MKISSYNSNTISLVPDKINEKAIKYAGYEKELSLSEKRSIGNKIKTLLGIVYFITLMYFLFVLLT